MVAARAPYRNTGCPVASLIEKAYAEEHITHYTFATLTARLDAMGLIIAARKPG